MKSVKYVERNQIYHSDVKQMRPNQEVDQKISPNAEQEENENVGIASCITQFNTPAWVSRNNRALSYIYLYMHAYMCSNRGLYGPPAGLVPQIKIIITIVRKPGKEVYIRVYE